MWYGDVMKKYFVILIVIVLLVGGGVFYLYLNTKDEYKCKDIAGGEFSIVFDTNGGVKIDDISVCIGCENSLAGELPVAERRYSVTTSKEYAFEGWYYDRKLTNKVKSNKISDLELFKILNSHNCLVGYGNINLYAKWVPKYFTIAFDSNGGNKVESIRATYNEELKKLPVPVKENFVFKGWYTVNNDLVSNGDKLDSQNITLYAKWKKK